MFSIAVTDFLRCWVFETSVSLGHVVFLSFRFRIVIVGPGPLGPGPTWALGPLGPWAHLGPGPTWALGPLGPGPTWAQGPLGPWAHLGPGPTWALAHLGPGPFGPWPPIWVIYVYVGPWSYSHLARCAAPAGCRNDVKSGPLGERPPRQGVLCRAGCRVSLDSVKILPQGCSERPRKCRLAVPLTRRLERSQHAVLRGQWCAFFIHCAARLFRHRAITL